MSTKATIKYGKSDGIDFHLYEECMEDDCVYLELRGTDKGRVEFDAGGNSVTVRVPLSIWEYVRHGTHAILGSEFDNKTDEQILEMARTGVEKRLLDHAAGSKWAGLAGSLTFGTIDAPKEEQIQRGFESFKIVRDHLKAVREDQERMQKESKQT